MQRLSVPLMILLPVLAGIASCAQKNQDLLTYSGSFEYLWSHSRESPPQEGTWQKYSPGQILDASDKLGQTVWFRTQPLPAFATDVMHRTGNLEERAHLFADPNAVAGIYSVHMCDTVHRFGRMNHGGYTYYVRRVWPIVALPAGFSSLKHFLASSSHDSQASTLHQKENGISQDTKASEVPGNPSSENAERETPWKPAIEDTPGSTQHMCRLYIASITGDGNNRRGITLQLKLGTEDALRTFLILSEADILMLGVLFLGSGLLFLPIVAYRKDAALASFSIFLICIGMFHFFRSDLAWYLSGLDNIRFFYARIFLYLVPTGLLYFSTRLFKARPQWILRALLGIYLVMLALVLIVEGLVIAGMDALNPWSVFEYYLIGMIPFSLSFIGASLYGGFFGGNREQRIFSVGLLLFLGAVVNDLIQRNSIEDRITLSEWGLLAFVLSLLLIVVSRFFQNQSQLQKYNVELEQTNRTLDRFVPRQFLDMLGRQSLADVHLGDQTERQMTVLFLDIRSFTNQSESMSPEENFNFINGYLRRVGPIIRRNNGLIDKYIGDAIMALFDGAPDEALRAMVEIQHELNLYNQERERKNRIPIRIGAGMHTGRLMLGTVGEEQRMQGTVISDAVNLASRLESMSKAYNVPAIVSGDTLQLCQGADYQVRYIGRFAVKGRSAPVSVFELLDLLNPELQKLRMQSQDALREAVQLVASKKYEEASQILQEILERDPEDGAARYYLKLCQKRIQSVIADWARDLSQDNRAL